MKIEEEHFYTIAKWKEKKETSLKSRALAANAARQSSSYFNWQHLWLLSSFESSSLSVIWKNFGLLAESTTAYCFNFVISLNAEDKFSNNKNTWFAKQLLSVLLIWNNWRRINPSPGFQVPPHHSGSRIIPFFVVCVYVKVIDFHVHTVCFLIYNVQWRWYGDKWWLF